MDVFEVIEEGKKAIDYVRSGNGPMLIEMDSYRYRGHSMSDPATYRSKEEVSGVKANKDPIDNFRSKILANSTITESEIKNIDKKIKEEVNSITEFAKNSPEPCESELMTNIYNY
jgi:pyruvate dehydrogenase E1 component alpha subunit